MNARGHPSLGGHARHTPGTIVAWLQQQRYSVYAIATDDQCYSVEAHDADGTTVELKVDPETRTIWSWIIAGSSGPEARLLDTHRSRQR